MNLWTFQNVSDFFFRILKSYNLMVSAQSVRQTDRQVHTLKNGFTLLRKLLSKLARVAVAS